MRYVRQNTHIVLELMEEGALSWEVWARETLAYLSEDQVTEIAETLEILPLDDDEEDEDEEDEDDDT